MGLATAALSVADLWDEDSWIRAILVGIALLALLILSFASPVTCLEVVTVVVAVLGAIGGYHAFNSSTAEAAPSACVTEPSETAVSRGRAQRILRTFGANAVQAEETADSFTLPIGFAPERAKTTFLRYFSGKREGRYLTRSRFRTPISAQRALYLPYSNKATRVQVVTVTEPTMVLEGGVHLGKPGTKQFFVLQPGCFRFGPGTKLPG